MAWPKGRSRKPQPQQQPEAAAHDPALIEPELVDDGASKSKPDPRIKSGEAKAKEEDRPRKPWTMRKSDELLAKVEDFEPDDWRDRTNDDLLAIPEEAKQWLRDHGLVCQWCTVSVLGQEQRRHFAQFQANGWTPV